MLFGLRRVGGALPGLRGAAGRRGALPGGAGFAFELAAPKKA